MVVKHRGVGDENQLQGRNTLKIVFVKGLPKITRTFLYLQTTIAIQQEITLRSFVKQR